MEILQANLPCPPPEDLPYPGIKPRSPALQVNSTISATREAQEYWILPDPGIELGSHALQVDSLPAVLPGKLYIHLLL